MNLNKIKKVDKVDSELEGKDIILNPNTTGYNDRKMAKWQGLILSEHTEKVNQENINSRHVNIEKKQLPAEDIYRLVDFSFSQKKSVNIQLDCLFNGKYQDDIVGVVFGYYENNIYIQTVESEIVVCELDLIRNIEESKLTKWFTA